MDFLCPAAVGYDFWLAFQFASIRAIGLHDKMSLDFEHGLLTFPNDSPDTLAGKNRANAEEIELLRKYNRKPRNRRANFVRKLDGIAPFNFEWTNCSDNFSKDSIFILRDRALLKQFKMQKNWSDLKGDDCLVPVSIEVLSKGIPKRLALIYLPNKDDIKQIRQMPGPIIINYDNQPQSSGSEMSGHDQEGSKFPEYISLSESNTGEYIRAGNAKIDKLVSPKNLFPLGADKNQLKRARNRRERERKRQKKRPKEDQPDLGRNDESHVSNIDKLTNRDSRKRLLIGRITRGDYSFVKARGAAFGYVSLSAMKWFSEPAKFVLVRNIENNYAYPALLRIHQNQIDV